MKKIACIAGTRPQLVKHSILLKSLRSHFIVDSLNTTQHHQYELNDLLKSDLFSEETFNDLILNPSVPPGKRLAEMISGIFDFLQDKKPDAVLVYGDTDTTLAGALVANKMKFPLIHIEAGERSFNPTMPEEANRKVCDMLAQILFCASPAGLENLKNEKNINHCIYSGDIMKDLLLQTAPKLKASLLDEAYIYCTIHRDYNKENAEKLKALINTLTNLNYRIIFPAHPATYKTIKNLAFSIKDGKYKNIDFLPPLSYSKNIQYQKFAKAIITDSGGIQKEAYWLQVPCITFRKETEWRETLAGNWNVLVYDETEQIQNFIDRPLGGYNRDLYGNGHAAEIITKHLIHLI